MLGTELGVDMPDSGESGSELGCDFSGERDSGGVSHGVSGMTPRTCLLAEGGILKSKIERQDERRTR